MPGVDAAVTGSRVLACRSLRRGEAVALAGIRPACELRLSRGAPAPLVSQSPIGRALFGARFVCDANTAIDQKSRERYISRDHTAILRPNADHEKRIVADLFVIKQHSIHENLLSPLVEAWRYPPTIRKACRDVYVSVI